MTATIGLVLDCADPHHLAEFWSSALGYRNAGTAGSYVVRRGFAADVCNARERDLAGITVSPPMRALRSIAAARRWRPLGRSAGQSRRDA